MRTTRRWLRFSLRTLLVLVTLVCLYLGWAMNWIRQRRQYLEYLETQRSPLASIWIPRPDLCTAPWQLRMLGEDGVFELGWRNDPTSAEVPLEQIKELERLFPEADVVILVDR